MAQPASFHDVECGGVYPRHLQGICTNDRDAVYWSWTEALVKTDREGRILMSIPVADHHGDLCHHDGKIYVAVNLGKFNQPEGKADSWVFVYDAGTLEELARHPVPEALYGAGGMACREGKFYVVGGLPPGTNENYIYEYNAGFKFQKRHVLASGYTLMGVQTLAWVNGEWWFGCYGKPPELLRADARFQFMDRRPFDVALGVVEIPGGKVLLGGNALTKGEGYRGWVKVLPASVEALKTVQKK